MFIFYLSLIVSISLSRADITWPEYSQQCRDDAGPPFLDDEPGKFYHDGSAAYPVLNNGQCAVPMQTACASRPTYKTAYLEGPIGCGGNGWYCRIYKDDANGWPNINLQGDVNFGECNKEESFDDAGYDRDGHCHGSSDDSAYYWWIRDHWHRQYNGKVRCCCGWYTGGTQPLYSGRIANRCDYRRLVTSTEDLSACRDANEDHGLGYDDIGCDPQYIDSQLNQVIPEDDNVCWEIERFGFTETGGDVPTANPASIPSPTPPVTFLPTSAPVPLPTNPPTEVDGTASPTTTITSSPTTTITSSPTPPSPITDSDCDDSELKFLVNGKLRTCGWVGQKNTSIRCSKGSGAVATHCPSTCNACTELECADATKRFRLTNGNLKSCVWVARTSTAARCEKDGVDTTCRSTCNYCE